MYVQYVAMNKQEVVKEKARETVLACSMFIRGPDGGFQAKKTGLVLCLTGSHI